MSLRMSYIFSLHPVRCKIVWIINFYNKFKKKTEYLGCEISNENEMITKTNKMFSSTGNSKQHNKTNFDPESFKNESI